MCEQLKISFPTRSFKNIKISFIVVDIIIMNITVDFNYNSSIYEKSSNSFKKLSEEDLKKEDIEDLETITVSSTKTNKKEQLIQVAFRDSDTDEIVTLNINKESLLKLMNNFKEGDFKIREDGTVRITGKAESFISGWHDDVVDNRGKDLVGVDLRLEYNYLEEKIKKSEGEIESRYFSYEKMVALSGAIDKDTFLEGLTPQQKKMVEPLVDLANMSLDYYRNMISLFSDSKSSVSDRLQDSLLNDKNLDGTIDFSEKFDSSVFKDSQSKEEFINNMVSKQFSLFKESGMEDVSFEKFKVGGGLKDYDPQAIELAGLGNADNDNSVQLFNFQDKQDLKEMVAEMVQQNSEEERIKREENSKQLVMEKEIVKFEQEANKTAQKTINLLREATKDFSKEEKEHTFSTITTNLNSLKSDKENYYYNLGDYFLKESPNEKETKELLTNISERINNFLNITASIEGGVEPEVFKESTQRDKKTIEILDFVTQNI